MSSKQFELRKEINTFHNSLEILRDFITLIDAYLEEKNFEILKSHNTEIVAILLGAIKTGVLPEDIVKSTSNEDINVVEAMQKHLDSTLKTKIEFEPKEKNGKKTFSWKFQDKDKGKDLILSAVKRISNAQRRSNLLYNSALMSLSSSVELLFSKLFHKYYEYFPDAIDSKDKSFTFEELKRFDTLADARQHYISTKIETILHKSFSDWLDELKKKPKLSLDYIQPELDILVETFKRRNLIVHNGGVVNSIYLNSVSKTLTENITLGDELEPDREYLNERIDAIERNCILVAAELWKTITKIDNNRADTLNEITYNHLISQKWSIAEALSNFITNDKYAPSIYQTIGKLNYWLCKKRQGKWNEVIKDIETADFSDKSLKSQLGFAALKEKGDEFFSLLPKALQVNEISIEELNEFPIFDEMRQDLRFEQYRNNSIETEAVDTKPE